MIIMIYDDPTIKKIKSLFDNSNGAIIISNNLSKKEKIGAITKELYHYFYPDSCEFNYNDCLYTHSVDGKKSYKENIKINIKIL